MNFIFNNFCVLPLPPPSKSMISLLLGGESRYHGIIGERDAKLIYPESSLFWGGVIMGSKLRFFSYRFPSSSAETETNSSYQGPSVITVNFIFIQRSALF